MSRGKRLPARARPRYPVRPGRVRSAPRGRGDDPALTPNGVILGEGFCGGLRRFLRPRTVYDFSYEDIGASSPFDALAEAEASLRPGEAVAGFLSYECAAASEAGLVLPKPPHAGPAAWFAVFEAHEPLAAADLEAPGLLSSPAQISAGDPPGRYRERVRDIRERIAAGDVFQVNYSHRQWAAFDPDERRLLHRLPWTEALSARFGALIDLGSFAVLSASPELFLKLEGRRLVSEPIKGTRPRSGDPDTDRSLADDLLRDPKDRAENVMIADLLRNDLARVCDDGSIAEPVICGLRSFAEIHHLYSRIEGDLTAGLGFADALRAAFPCGSVTGAPKIAAMEAISELEGEGRGPYCGTVFFRDRDRGAASVAIRTAVIDETSRSLHVRSGGGVTTLSDPEAEYREALDKGYLFRHLTGRP